MTADPPGGERDRGPQDDEQEEEEAGSAGHVFDMAPAVAGQVAGRDEHRRPHHAAGGVVDQEPAVVEAGHAGQPRDGREAQR